jgi:hypothetical protein
LDGVFWVFEDYWVGEEAFESKMDPIEIRFNYHETTKSALLDRETKRESCVFFN